MGSTTAGLWGFGLPGQPVLPKDDSSPFYFHVLSQADKGKGSVSPTEILVAVAICIFLLRSTWFLLHANVEQWKSILQSRTGRDTFICQCKGKREVFEFSVHALQFCFTRCQLRFSLSLFFLNKWYPFPLQSHKSPIQFIRAFECSVSTDPTKCLKSTELHSSL